MSVTVVYVFPVCAGQKYLEYAVRFLTTYAEYHPGIDHETVIACNGGDPGDEIKFMFSVMPNVKFMVRNNDAYDIGAYQQAAKEYPCDLMVFFGATTYLKGAGWLVRMIQVFLKHGPGVYGVMANRGNQSAGVWPHLRTTGFWCPPDLINRFPHKITKTEERYAWEHGRHCFFNWVKSQRLPVMAVSWTGEYNWAEWDSYPNGFHRGDQSALMCGDRLSEGVWASIR